MAAEVVTDDPWATILRVVGNEKGRTIAAIAYVTKGLLKLRRDDFLVCDASEGSVKSGNTDPKVLLQYLKKGVRIWNHPGLHAKTIFRGRIAVVGSANSSSASADGQLTELVAVLRDRSTVMAVRQRIEALSRRSISLDPISIERLVPLYKPAKRLRTRRKSARALEQVKSRAWCIGTHYANERPSVETARERGSPKAHRSTLKLLGKHWTKNYRVDGDLSWSGRSVDRLDLGDNIFDILERKTLRPPGTLVHIEPIKGAKGAVLFICRDRNRRSRSLKSIRKRVEPAIFKLIKNAGMRQLTLTQLDSVNEVFAD
jgi:hypothetical protein